MQKLKELSVFFPAYNEEENIPRMVENALKVIPSFSESFEVIIVNDGSSDNTEEVARAFSEKYPNVRVVSHEKNRGYGAALKTGFSSSKYENIFFTDGDGQFHLEEIDRILPLAHEADLAIGYRMKRNDPIHRIINGKAYNLLVRILFGVKVRDIDCAFKIIKKKVTDSIPLKSESQFVSAELLIKAKKNGFTIKQTGVHHFPREIGKPTGNSIKAIVNSFKELFKLWKELR